MVTTQIDILNLQIAKANAQKVVNSADNNYKNGLLDKNITDWNAQIEAIQNPPQE